MTAPSTRTTRVFANIGHAYTRLPLILCPAIVIVLGLAACPVVAAVMLLPAVFRQPAPVRAEEE